MTIEEIYDNPDLCKVEEELVRIFRNYAPIDSQYGLCSFNGDGKDIVRSLFDKRKKLLDDMFVMDDEHKSLLYDFNEALKAGLTDMRRKTMEAYDAVVSINHMKKVNVEARCYLGLFTSILSSNPARWRINTTMKESELTSVWTFVRVRNQVKFPNLQSERI